MIALVLLLVAGADRLGAIGSGLGHAVKAFRRTLREAENPRLAPRQAAVISVRQTPIVVIPESPPLPVRAPEPKLLAAKGGTSPANYPDGDRSNLGTEAEASPSPKQDAKGTES